MSTPKRPIGLNSEKDIVYWHIAEYVAYTGIEYLDLHIVISHGMTAELIRLDVVIFERT